MGRPVGVTILAVLYFAGAALCVLLGVGMIAGGGLIANIINQQAQRSGAGGAGFLAGMGVVLGVFFFVIGAVDVLLGWGLWALKNWARIVSVVLTAISFAFQLLGLARMLAHFNLFNFIWTLCVLAVEAWIIAYLLKANVAAAFRGGQARTASA